MLRSLPAREHVSTPWNNGQGVTTDVLLWPEGAGREDFDIRISLAPIVAEVPFSSFPGIDRHITLIEGAELGLEFDDRHERLLPLVPLYFDSIEAPTSRLPAGAGKVLNVMTRRGVWAAHMQVWRGSGRLTLTADEMLLAYVIAGNWEGARDAASCRLEQGDGLLAEGAGALDLDTPHGTALIARLSRVG